MYNNFYNTKLQIITRGQYTMVETTTVQPLPTHMNKKAHRSPSPMVANDNSGRRLIRPRQEDDIHQTISAHEIPSGQSNNNFTPTDNSNNSTTSTSYPSSKTALLAFLFFVSIAIMHAIASGFEGMHESKQKQQSPPQQQQSANSQLIQESTDNISYTNNNNNEDIYERSVEDELNNNIS